MLDTTVLQSNVRYLQRAHMVLAFILHFYVHSTPTEDRATTICIPKSIAVPIVAVSKALGTAPVMTFADTVLWNWELVRPDLPLSADNIRYVNILSGCETERSFYAGSGAVELKGVEMLRIIDSFMTLPNIIDRAAESKIEEDLIQLKRIVDELTAIFESMRSTVDPKAFYWYCRPWWNGSPSSGSGKPQWVYEGVSSRDTQFLSGPSAGQSSVMHALDIFLDIDHKLQKKREPAPSEANRRADTGFMERMRNYMPGLHRAYLQYLVASPRTVRDVAEKSPRLREAYNGAVMALKHLRDVHVRIVTLYVVTQSHHAPPSDVQMKERGSGAARGTGGMEASILLKHGRDATARAKLP